MFSHVSYVHYNREVYLLYTSLTIIIRMSGTYEHCNVDKYLGDDHNFGQDDDDNDDAGGDGGDVGDGGDDDNDEEVNNDADDNDADNDKYDDRDNDGAESIFLR